jgi:DNA processing protein
MDNELEYWLRISALEGIGIQMKLELVTKFGSASQVFNADKSTLLSIGLALHQYEALHNDEIKREAINIQQLCESRKIKILPLSHVEYPEMLKYIQDPPLVLYARGRIPRINAMAVVGSRKASGYGIEMAVKFASELAQSGILVVSGMARGIDTAAHCGALNAGGETVAVLGCGVDTVYPPENRNLMEKISQSGAVISEYPPGTPPATFHFPSRNRIISGMTLGTLVVEAGFKSGSLITSKCALEQGRDVFAVPGNITNFNSMGANRLIKDGAKLVMNVDDILDELNFGLEPIEKGKRKKKIQRIAGLGANDKKIINALKLEDLYDEELSEKTGIPLKDLFELLLDLELKNLIKKSLTGKYMHLA